jgi:hypothetical protein
MAAEGRTGLLPIPRGSGKFDAVVSFQASLMSAVAECVSPSQSTRADAMGSSGPIAGPVDSGTPHPASLSG